MSPSTQHTIVQICQAFEVEFRAGQGPQITDFLSRVSADRAPILFVELLQLECDLRRSAGETIDWQIYRDRFSDRPELVARVKQRLETASTSSRDGLLETRLFVSHMSSPLSTDELPAKIGKYSIIAKLGGGAFGVVYLAKHPQLDRQVAIKIPRPDRFPTESDLEQFLDEARKIAKLKHPGIVSVYDVDEDAPIPFIVQEFIDGSDLASVQRAQPFSPSKTALAIAAIAEAIAHAHQHGIVHRDLKPKNILVDFQGKIFVADFGLALREERRRYHKGELCGTPYYMSPEQVRSESNRIDGRTDIWALGVMLYEMLAGEKPFNGANERELFDEILSVEPKPIRQIRPDVPPELERICFRCMSKRMADRYSNSIDLATDLRFWSEKEEHDPLTESRKARRQHVVTEVIPKGLRSFDHDDADFFLELLPGPRDRQGLPEVVRFWKSRIESNDPERAITVGLVYGPSGGGKSSLIKAGVLPLLSSDIIAVYVEATRENTETRLLQALRKRIPSLPECNELPELIAELRSNVRLVAGKRLLIVFDQFEQWLHSTSHYEHASLVQALRHCDGTRVQALIIVRDDFWMAVTRFFRALEVELVEGQNSAAVDRFELGHAKRVLALFGEAYGALPRAPEPRSREQESFLQQAVEALAEDGTVVGVRLALFAEMIKGKPWIPPTLKAAGGADGIGVAFLDETFGSSVANPKFRLHATAAFKMLKQLLPDTGIDIKGHMQSARALSAAAGYQPKSRDFQDVIQLLDRELHLITPTDPKNSQETPSADGEPYYQLTHDFLVPAIRTWISRKQTQTKQGRAELRLAERTRLWTTRKEKQQLPSFWEFVAIRSYSTPALWLDEQKAMMRSASRFYATRALAIVAISFIVGSLFFWGYQISVVASLVRSLTTAETSDVPGILAELAPYKRLALYQVRNTPVGSSSKAELHLDLARLRLGAAGSEPQSRIQAALLSAPPDEARVIAAELKPVADQVAGEFWEIVAHSDNHQRIFASCTFLALHFPNDPRWERQAELISNTLINSNPRHVEGWIENLAPIRKSIASRLSAFYRKVSAASPTVPLSPFALQQRNTAALSLARFLTGEPAELSNLLVFHTFDAHDFHGFLEPLMGNRTATEHVQTQWRIASGQQTGPDATVRVSVPATANAIVALVLLRGDDDLLRSSLKGMENQTLATRLIHQLSTLGVSPEIVYRAIAVEHDPDVRSALLMSLGEYPSSTVPQSLRQSIEREMQKSIAADDASESACASWLAQRWETASLDQTMTRRESIRNNWFSTPSGHRLIAIRNRLNHSFAIGSREVSIAQYEKFNANYRTAYQSAITQSLVEGTPGECPVVYVSAYDVMQYCNWLSSQDDLTGCYDEVGDGTFRAKNDYLKLNGYRLPTHEEWVTACRSGVSDSFSFGDELGLLEKYAWYYSNSRSNGLNRAHPVGQLKPNRFGLFDMYGNIWEWATETSNPATTVLCGGSCDNEPVDLQAIDRLNHISADSREHRIGIRLARTIFEDEKG